MSDKQFVLALLPHATAYAGVNGWMIYAAPQAPALLSGAKTEEIAWTKAARLLGRMGGAQ